LRWDKSFFFCVTDKIITRSLVDQGWYGCRGICFKCTYTLTSSLKAHQIQQQTDHEWDSENSKNHSVYLQRDGINEWIFDNVLSVFCILYSFFDDALTAECTRGGNGICRVYDIKNFIFQNKIFDIVDISLCSQLK
jgi:hypothetical protein